MAAVFLLFCRWKAAHFLKPEPGVLTHLYSVKYFFIIAPFHAILKEKAVMTMARLTKYIIRLSDNEITTLQRTIKNKATCKTVLKRCQILLELDETHGTGLTHAQIANSYGVCPSAITNTIQAYVKNGITDIIKYNISPNSSAARRKACICRAPWRKTPCQYPGAQDSNRLGRRDQIPCGCHVSGGGIVLVMDNLNTHKPASSYKRYPTA